MKSTFDQIRLLELLSAVYLAVPCALFMGVWLRPVWAVGAVSLIAAGVFQYLKRAPETTLPTVLPFSRPTLVATGVVALLSVAMSGIGGFGIQYWDYYKHNAILNFLIQNHWPVHFSLPGIGGVYLVHALPYYLVSATVGKALGWAAANGCAFIMGVFGFWLTLSWFSVLVGKPSIWPSLLFLLAGGLDFLGSYILSGKFPALSGDPEWWSWPWQYSSQSTLLFFVPHHALSSWIVTGLLLYRWSREEDALSVLFWMAIGLSWSTFLFVGWIPFLVLMLWKTRGRVLLSVQNLICAPPLIILLALFYNARGVPVEHGWTWNASEPLRYITHYLVFITMEFGLYAMWTARETFAQESRLAPCWNVAVAVLCLLPFYTLGSYNDLMMRASIPSLFVLYLFVAKTLLSDKPLVQKPSLALLFVLGSVTALVHLMDGSRALIALQGRQNALLGDGNFMLTPEGRNYFGNEKSYFFMHLARR